MKFPQVGEIFTLPMHPKLLDDFCLFIYSISDQIGIKEAESSKSLGYFGS